MTPAARVGCRLLTARALRLPAPASPLTLTPRLTHNHRADAKGALPVLANLDAAAAPPARDRERALCCSCACEADEHWPAVLGIAEVLGLTPVPHSPDR